MGSMDYPVNNANVQISLTEQPRGAISSYYFPGSPSGWISPGASLLTTFPAKNAHPYSNEMTVEVDFKWTGPADTTADGNYCIFDNGEYTNRGWRLVYRNRRKCLTLHLGTSKTTPLCIMYHLMLMMIIGTQYPYLCTTNVYIFMLMGYALELTTMSPLATPIIAIGC